MICYSGNDHFTDGANSGKMFTSFRVTFENGVFIIAKKQLATRQKNKIISRNDFQSRKKKNGI